MRSAMCWAIGPNTSWATWAIRSLLPRKWQEIRPVLDSPAWRAIWAKDAFA